MTIADKWLIAATFAGPIIAALLAQFAPSDVRAREPHNRMAFLTGLYSESFPSLGGVDAAWDWYSKNNHYVTRDLPRRGFRIARGWPGRRGAVWRSQ